MSTPDIPSQARIIAALTIISNVRDGWRTEILPSTAPGELIMVRFEKWPAVIYGYGETLETAVQDAIEYAHRESGAVKHVRALIEEQRSPKADPAETYDMPDRTVPHAE